MYQKGHDHYAVDIVVVWYNCSWFSDCHSSVSNPEITWDCKLKNHLAWSYGFLWASYKQALQCTVNWFLFSAVGLSISMWRQRGRVVRARSWVQIPFWLLADVVHDSPKFNFSSTLVNSQVVCLQPVGILNLVLFIIWIFIYHCLLTLDLKSPNGEWPITYTYLHIYLLDTANQVFF